MGINLKKSFLVLSINLFLIVISFASHNNYCKADEHSLYQDTIHPSEQYLKILSWNIYMLPPMILFTGKQQRAGHIGDILKDSEYDVLVFQEAFNPKARKILSRKLSNDFPYQAGPFNPAKGFKTNSGVWILSRYPLKIVGTVEYEQKEGLDNKMARKGAGMVEISVNGKLIHIIGTHLNAGGDISVRHSQVMQIRKELIDKYSQKDIPLIICGDMNIECAHPEYYDKLVDILGADDCIPGGYPRCYTSNHTDNDFSGSGVPEVIDYFFFRLPIGCYSNCDVPVIQREWGKKNKSLSDHEPVSMELYWK